MDFQNNFQKIYIFENKFPENGFSKSKGVFFWEKTFLRKRPKIPLPELDQNMSRGICYQRAAAVVVVMIMMIKYAKRHQRASVTISCRRHAHHHHHHHHHRHRKE